MKMLLPYGSRTCEIRPETQYQSTASQTLAQREAPRHPGNNVHLHHHQVFICLVNYIICVYVCMCVIKYCLKLPTSSLHSGSVKRNIILTKPSLALCPDKYLPRQKPKQTQ